MKAGRWMRPNGTTGKDMDTSCSHLATWMLNTPLAIAPDRIAAIAAMLRDGRSGSAMLAYDSTTAAGQNVAANRPYQVEAGIAIIPVAGPADPAFRLAGAVSGRLHGGRERL